MILLNYSRTYYKGKQKKKLHWDIVRFFTIKVRTNIARIEISYSTEE